MVKTLDSGTKYHRKWWKCLISDKMPDEISRIIATVWITDDCVAVVVQFFHLGWIFISTSWKYHERILLYCMFSKSSSTWCDFATWRWLMAIAYLVQMVRPAWKWKLIKGNHRIYVSHVEMHSNAMFEHMYLELSTVIRSLQTHVNARYEHDLCQLVFFIQTGVYSIVHVAPPFTVM